MAGIEGRRLNNHQLSGIQGLTLAFDKDGRTAEGIVWAGQDKQGMAAYGVSDYLNEGYELVSPKRVERLPGGTFRPSDGKDFGVRFDFDAKADRVTNPLGLTLMYRPPEVARRLEAEQQAAIDARRRKTTAEEVAKRAANGRIDAAVFGEEQDEGARSIT